MDERRSPPELAVIGCIQTTSPKWPPSLLCTEGCFVLCFLEIFLVDFKEIPTPEWCIIEQISLVKFADHRREPSSVRQDQRRVRGSE